VAVRAFINAHAGQVPADDELNPEERVRRVALLCGHCLRNVAFYRAGWKYDRHRPRVSHTFWIGAHGAFVDLAVLDWCKVFADSDSTHGWRTVVSDVGAFKRGLLARLTLDTTEFEAYKAQMVVYRNDFVAHLNDERTGYIPFLWPAKRSAAYLLTYLQQDVRTRGHLTGVLCESPSEMYGQLYRMAFREYTSGERQKAVQAWRD